LPHPGQYDFVVLADGQEIDRQTFAATPRSDRPKPKNQGDVDPPALDE
jgi:hypothetical protein